MRFPGGPPVGSGYPSSYEETTVALPYGFTVLLYTDGLIERRGELLSEGEARLAAVADDGEISPDALVARVLAQLAPEGATSDDIALLAVQNDQPQHEALRIRVDAIASELGHVRRVLRRWLAATKASSWDVDAIVLSAHEACANAIEHAYGPGDASLGLKPTRMAT